MRGLEMTPGCDLAEGLEASGWSDQPTALPDRTGETGVEERRRSLTRLERLPYFTVEDYLQLNPDVAQAAVDPLEHAALTGIREGRPFFRPQRIVRALVQEASDPVGIWADWAQPQACPLGEIRVHVSSLGNVYMHELAMDLVRDLESAGVQVSLCDEASTPRVDSGLSIFVAPHEFFTLGRGKQWASADLFRHSVMLNTEQIQTPWFLAAFPALLSSAAILDLCSQSAALFRRADIAAAHYEPSPLAAEVGLHEEDLQHDLVRSLPEAAREPVASLLDWSQRSVDVCFFGNESPRREEYLARMAPILAPYRSCIYYRRQAAPLQSGGESGALARIAAHVAGHSRISLNIHQGDFPYFEWHRIVRLGMARGSLVVTDPCLPHPRLTPGVHFLQEESRHIPDLIDWILRDEEGSKLATTIAANARRYVLDEASHAERINSLVSFLARVESRLHAQP